MCSKPVQFMSTKYQLVDLLNALFTFKFSKISEIIRSKHLDFVGGLFLILNIFSVGIAAATSGDQFSFFFPSLDRSITFGNAFIIGIFFQSVVVLIYSAFQSFLLEFFDANVSFDRALIMIGYAGLWFIPAALLVNTNLIISLFFALISFSYLVIIVKEFANSEIGPTILGVGLASLFTGIISVTLSLLISFVV